MNHLSDGVIHHLKEIQGTSLERELYMAYVVCEMYCIITGDQFKCETSKYYSSQELRLRNARFSMKL